MTPWAQYKKEDRNDNRDPKNGPENHHRPSGAAHMTVTPTPKHHSSPPHREFFQISPRNCEGKPVKVSTGERRYRI
jgi:hypothetical protein